MRWIVILLLVVLLCTLVGGLLSTGIFLMGGVDILAAQSDSASLDYAQRNFLRIGVFVSHLFTFVIPALVYLKYFDTTGADNNLEEFSHNIANKPTWQGILSPLRFQKPLLGYWTLLMFLCIPIVGQLAIWNASIPFPSSLISTQEDSLQLIQNIMQMDDLFELFLSILMVGIAAGVGEELLFRGIIQRKLESIWGHPHLAIWGTALLFGVIHFRVEQLLPLTFVGALMGYAYYYTRNIWVPIIMHFLFNSLQTVGAYFSLQQDEAININDLPEMPLVAVICSILLSLGAAYLAVYKSKSIDEPRP